MCQCQVSLQPDRKWVCLCCFLGLSFYLSSSYLLEVIIITTTIIILIIMTTTIIIMTAILTIIIIIVIQVVWPYSCPQLLDFVLLLVIRGESLLWSFCHFVIVVHILFVIMPAEQDYNLSISSPLS